MKTLESDLNTAILVKFLTTGEYSGEVEVDGKKYLYEQSKGGCCGYDLRHFHFKKLSGRA